MLHPRDNPLEHDVDFVIRRGWERPEPVDLLDVLLDPLGSRSHRQYTMVVLNSLSIPRAA